MAYRLPDFHLPCQVRLPGTPVGSPYNFDSVCQVIGLLRPPTGVVQSTAVAVSAVTIIKLPAGSPLYDQSYEGNGSRIRVLGGYNVLFLVESVWDVALGYPNEYRACSCVRLSFLPHVPAWPPGSLPV